MTNHFSFRMLAASLVLFGAVGSSVAEDRIARVDHSLRVMNAAQMLREIALQSGNTLNGTVVDDAGMPQANYEVWVATDNGQAVKTRTDASGRFTMPGLRPGIYSIDTPCGGGKFRLWEAKDAPREAQSNVLLIVCTKQSG